MIGEYRGIPITPRYPRGHAKAGQVIPAPPPTPFEVRYPKDHPDYTLAGKDVVRSRECPRCFSVFTQQLVNQAYIDDFTLAHAAAFLRLCEVEGDETWHPGRCDACERKQLDRSEIPPFL